MRHHHRRGACAAANTVFHAQRERSWASSPARCPDGADVPARARSASTATPATPLLRSSAAAARWPATCSYARRWTGTSPARPRRSSRTRPTSTWPDRRTTTPGSGTRTRSTASSTGSPTTTTPGKPRTSRWPTRSTRWSPSVG